MSLLELRKKYQEKRERLFQEVTAEDFYRAGRIDELEIVLEQLDAEISLLVARKKEYQKEKNMFAEAMVQEFELIIGKKEGEE